MILLKAKANVLNKFLISGIAPDMAGGVSRLMQHLETIGMRQGYIPFFLAPGKSLKLLLRKRKFLVFLKELLNQFFRRIRFSRKIKAIKNSEVFIIHHFDVGIKNLLHLYNNNLKIKLFLTDNSFFCLKSYNHVAGKKHECLRCLGNPDKCLSECKPASLRTPRNECIYYLKQLPDFIDRITFLAQNKNQEELLKLHFGRNINSAVIGMDTGEFEQVDINKKHEKSSGELVYHAGLQEAKGVLYVIELAKEMPEYNFLIPASRRDFIDQYNVVPPQNVAFSDITWESGLKEKVEKASLVLCPSLWSAPIEGALVKSIMLNGNVAVVKQKYSFSAEAPDGTTLILDEACENAAKSIQDFFANKIIINQEKAKSWIAEAISMDSVLNHMV